MSNVKKVKLNDVIDFSIPTNSGLTKSFVSLNKGKIPVYGASMNENEVSYGYIKDGLSNVKYFENCLTYNKDGSSGFLFYRKGRFSLSEKVLPIIIFEKYKNQLDYIFLKYTIESQTLKQDYAFNNKATKYKLKDIEIEIPIKADGTFDLEAQKELAKKYQDIENQKQVLIEKKEKLNKTKVEFDKSKNHLKSVLFTDILTYKSGSSTLTKAYMNSHKGEYPVYSAKTIGETKVGNIDSYMFDTEGLQLTTNGANAGTWLYREKHKFSLNGDARLYFPKDKYIDEISMEYMLFALQIAFNKKGFDWNTKATINNTKDIEIEIPIKADGTFDLEAQKELAKKYQDIENIKTNLCKKIDELMNIKFNLS